MIVVSTEQVPGKEIAEALGIARGSTVRARNIGRDIFAGLKRLKWLTRQYESINMNK